MGISTHILDTSRGRPAGGVEVRLERLDPQGPVALGAGTTDADGRVRSFAPSLEVRAGVHRLTFLLQPYLESHHGSAFFPEVVLTFRVADPSEHFHVPLLLSPYGYQTYRGS